MDRVARGAAADIPGVHSEISGGLAGPKISGGVYLPCGRDRPSGPKFFGLHGN
jgi:hypothetical protein